MGTLDGLTPGAYRAFLMNEERPPAAEGKLLAEDKSLAFTLGSGTSHLEPTTLPTLYLLAPSK